MADKNQALAKALRTSSNEPQYIRGNLLPFKKDIKTKEVSFGVPTVAQGLIDALSAPYRAMKGEIDVDSPQGVQEALNFGLNMMGGGLGVTAVKPVQSGSLGMFIGKTSPSWNAAKAKQAVELEKAGLDPQKIWAQTGTLRGPEGLLRQEIPDVGAKITDNVYEGIVKNKRFEGKMGDALSHPELYKAYPDTADIGTGMYAWKTPEGTYEQASRTITAGGPGTTSQKSAALHEIMHDIQQKEGYAKGGNLESFPSSQDINDAQIVSTLIKKGRLPSEASKWVRDNLGRNPSVSAMDLAMKKDVDLFNIPTNMEQYRRLAGEAEARLVQKRMNLTPEERLQNFPYEQGKFGLDVPYNELIIRK